MDDHTRRQQQRFTLIQNWIQSQNLEYNELSGCTLDCLDDWARLVLLVENQPSAGYGGAMNHLCRAVEAQIAASIGSLPDLEYLKQSTGLGSTSKLLSARKASQPGAQRLASLGYKTGFVYGALPDLLLRLNRLRQDVGAAHGGPVVADADSQVHDKAKRLTADILRGLIVGQREGRS